MNGNCKFLKKFIYFIYLFLAVLGLCCYARAFSSCGEWRLLFVAMQWLLLLRSMGCRCVGFSSCSTRARQLWLTGSRAQAQQLWHTGLVAPRHVGSSRTRVRTHVPCIGRQILKHCTTREALEIVNYLFVFQNIFSLSFFIGQIIIYLSTFDPK